MPIIKCRNCHGTGRVPEGYCTACGGHALVVTDTTKDKTFTVYNSVNKHTYVYDTEWKAEIARQLVGAQRLINKHQVLPQNSNALIYSVLSLMLLPEGYGEDRATGQWYTLGGE